MAKRPIVPDGGHAWLMVAYGFMVAFVGDGITFSSGVLLPELAKSWNVSEATASLAGSLFNGVRYGCSILAAILMEIHGYKPVALVGGAFATVCMGLSVAMPHYVLIILLFGICGGFGMGLMGFAGYLSVNLNFDKKRGVATGIVTSGSAIGSVCLAPLTYYIQTSFGWKWTFVSYTTLVFICSCLSFLLRPLKYYEEEEDSETNATFVQALQKGIFQPKLWKNSSFMMFFVARACGSLGIIIPFMFLPLLMESRGMSSRNASLVISALGLANFIGRLTGGFVSLLPSKWNPAFVGAGSSAILTGMALLGFTFSRHWIEFLIVATLYGILMGPYTALQTVLTLDCVGEDLFTPAMGIIITNYGLFTFLAPPIEGLLKQWLNWNNLPFYLSAGWFVLSGLCIFVSLSLVIRRERSQEN